MERLEYVEDCRRCGVSICGRFGERLSLCPGCRRYVESKRKALSRRTVPAADWPKLLAHRDVLTEREWEVLRDRHGLLDARRQTLAAIAARLNVTRERIRQIEGTARRKLWRAAYPTPGNRP
jgi:hypothetical protein